MQFTYKDEIVRGLGCKDNIFDKGVKQVFSNIWVFKDRYCTITHRPIEFLILIFNNELTLRPFGKSIYVLFFVHFPLSGIIPNEIYNHYKAMFPIYGFRIELVLSLCDHIP